MGLKEKLDLIESAKKDIRNKIIDKGVYVPESTPFKEYPNYINNIEANPIQLDVQEWTPDPLWWDIETIIQNDTNEGEYAWLDECGKCIVLYDDELDTQQFSVCSQNVTSDGSAVFAVKTSDGQLYTSTSTSSSGETKTHTWDRAKDKESSLFDKKTRYAILYRSTTTKLNIGKNMFNQCIYIINDGVNFHSNETNDYSTCGYLTLQAYKELSGVNTVQTSGRRIFYTNLAKYIELNTPLQTSYQIDAYKAICSFAKCATIKLGANAYSLTNDLKTYNVYLDSADNAHGVTIDVTDIDFTDCYNQIFTNTFFKKIIGIINLQNNTLNTNYTLFKSGSTYGSSCSYSLNLPSNADITINTPYVTKETAKYLIENAPTIAETHILKVPATMYSILKNLPYDCPVIYNGQQYGDGVQVLTLKGWTVQQL